MKLIKKSHPSFCLLFLMGMVRIGLASEEITPLTQAGQRIEDHYTQQLTILSEDLKRVVLSESEAKEQKLTRFLASDNLDPKLVKFVILNEARPRALAEFGQQGKNHFSLLESLFNDPKLMRQMLLLAAFNAETGEVSISFVDHCLLCVAVACLVFVASRCWSLAFGDALPCICYAPRSGTLCLKCKLRMH